MRNSASRLPLIVALSDCLLVATSRFTAKGNVVVEIEQVGPRLDVRAFRCGSLAEFVEKFQRLRVGHALFRGIGPCCDFCRSVFVRLVRANPFEDFAVALARLEFRAERVCVDAEIFEDALVERTIVIILAALAGDFRAAFVEHARQQGVTAEAGAHATGWTLREVSDVAHDMVVGDGWSYWAVKPPSTLRDVPVMNDAASEQRN